MNQIVTSCRSNKFGRSILLVVCCLVCLPIFAGCKNAQDNKTESSQESGLAFKGDGPQTLNMSVPGAYTGAYVDFGIGEGNVTFDSITDFDRLIGKHLAVVAFGNFWGEQIFPAKALKIIAGYGAIPLVFWSPWDKPYGEGRGPDRFRLQDIVAGKWDQYIDQWADAARQYGKPILVAWGLEMNGTWFPWSGYYYGAGTVVGKKDGQTLYAGPELVKKAFRYVVNRVRSRNATNVLWGFHANNFSIPKAPWNVMANYYPGSDYVDWLGLSVYGKMVKSGDWPAFADVMDAPYQEICRLDAKKPLVLAEWGVGEFPPSDKAEYITKAFHLLQTKYQRVKAAVYWHERWENSNGSFSNLRVNSSPEALKAYQTGVADPYWLDRPQFAPMPTGK